ncbi:MAG: hypothetical protein IT273_02400 [Chitinophagales bacterium]|nr:hypothetical protein [Chitinophagales bacterium]
MKKKIAALVLVVGLGAAYYAWSEFNRTAADPADVKAQVSLDANALLTAYESNEESADAQYTGKSVEVKGTVRSVEKKEDGSVEIMLETASELSAVSCSCMGDNAKAAEVLQKGATVTVRGTCTGYLSDVVITPCAVVQ